MTDTVFLLAETDERIDIRLTDDGEVIISSGTLMSRHAAEQLQFGIRAVLSGGFDRACSQSYLEFDLARRRPFVSRSDGASSRDSTLKPELDSL